MDSYNFSHFFLIVSAYGITFLVLGVLIIYVCLRWQKAKKTLKEIQARSFSEHENSSHDT